MTRFRAPAAVLTLLFAAGCSAITEHRPPGTQGRTAIEVGLAEQACMSQLQGYLIGLNASRMDAFFSAALNGLVRCEAYSGLAHLPTRDVSAWLVAASGRPVRVAVPPAPRAIAVPPQAEDERLPYQRACVAYMRRYLPASIARAGDEPDVAAAFIFNAAEQCDSAAGFATIAPRDLAAIMQAKHLL